jgi:hypothetical protein
MNIFERFGMAAGNRKLSDVELDRFAGNVSRMMMAHQKTAETYIRFAESTEKATGNRDSPLIPADLARHV